MKIAVIGAGLMGTQVARLLPQDLQKIVIDTDGVKAEECAKAVGADFATTLSAAGDADIIAVVLPAAVVNTVMSQLAGIAKDGAILMNMATSADVDESIKKENPSLRIIDCKTIGSAVAMEYGAPGFLIIGTKDEDAYSKISYALSGYTKVLMGDPTIVPKINSLGSEEGIRCGVRLRKRLAEYKIPKDWEDIVLYTVAAGTLQGFASGRLGHFAQSLADKIAEENI